MKGLLLNCMSKKTEAYEFAKKGLKADLRSHVCWHVLGLIYRSDRNYLEASKCYKSALRMDPGNAQIMRDLCLLQLHERDLEGYSETRRQMLAAKSGTKQTWIAYAVAEHVRGHPQLALDVLKKMDRAFANDYSNSEPPLGRYEESELSLYRVLLMLEANRFDEAIAVLESDEIIVDQVSKLEYLVYMHFAKDSISECRQVLAKLLNTNPSNRGYLLTLLAVRGVLINVPPRQVRQWLNFDTEKAPEVCIKQYLNPELGSATLASKLEAIRSELGLSPKNDAFTLLLLEFLALTDPIFESTLAAFLAVKMAKGVPSTFKLIRHLADKSVMRKLLLNQVSASESPEVKTYSLLVLAQYYDFSKEFDSAMRSIDEAVAITPTLVDLYVCKAKILKHKSDLVASSEMFEFARKLDLADRYLNSKSVKALLRVGQIDQATEVILLFAKDAPTGKSNLTDMQCMWWEFELGKAHLAKGQVNEALNVWNDTRKHFEEMSEDEFDFNYYCSRKMTLRSYVDFLKLQDKLRAHKCYRQIAHLFVSTLLKIARNEVKPDQRKKKAAPAGEEEVVKTDWFKDENVLAEAGILVKELQRKAPECDEINKLAFEVHYEAKEFALCVADTQKLSDSKILAQRIRDHPECSEEIKSTLK